MDAESTVSWNDENGNLQGFLISLGAGFLTLLSFLFFSLKGGSDSGSKSTDTGLVRKRKALIKEENPNFL